MTQYCVILKTVLFCRAYEAQTQHLHEAVMTATQRQIYLLTCATEQESKHVTKPHTNITGALIISDWR